MKFLLQFPYSWDSTFSLYDYSPSHAHLMLRGHQQDGSNLDLLFTAAMYTEMRTILYGLRLGLADERAVTHIRSRLGGQLMGLQCYELFSQGQAYYICAGRVAFSENRLGARSSLDIDGL